MTDLNNLPNQLDPIEALGKNGLKFDDMNTGCGKMRTVGMTTAPSRLEIAARILPAIIMDKACNIISNRHKIARQALLLKTDF